MPGVASTAALEEVCHQVSKSPTGGTAADYNYIKSMLQDLAANAINKDGHGSHSDPDAQTHTMDLVDMLQKEADDDEDIDELTSILRDRDLQDVLAAHDSIAKENMDTSYDGPEENGPQGPGKREEPTPPMEPIRVIGIKRQPNQPMGITVSNETGELIVVKILKGSVVDQQGLVHVGDIVREVNGQEVYTPEDLTDIVRREGGTNIQLKVVQRSPDHYNPEEMYLKAFFNYDPSRDTKLPAHGKGLHFEEGDILRILAQDDNSWWKAKNYKNNQQGIIPSPIFEERRRALTVNKGNDKKKSSLLCGLGRKKKYNVSKAPEGPPILYEPVSHTMPARRKLLILVGAQGIGRRSLKNRILSQYPESFGAALPNTSRQMREKEVDGVNYHFLPRQVMDRDIKAGRYLEYGELHNNLYGTSVDAVKEVVDSDKTCIVDVKAGVLGKLRSAEWMPYIIFLNPPSAASIKLMNTQALTEAVEVQKKSDEEADRIFEDSLRIQRQYRHLFDSTVIYDNFERAVMQILRRFEEANTEPQWIPSEWAAKNPEVVVIGTDSDQ